MKEFVGNTNMKEFVGNAVCASKSSDTQYNTTFSHSQSGALENRTSTMLLTPTSTPTTATSSSPTTSHRLP